MQQISAISGKRLANRVPFAVDEAPDIREKESNDDIEHAQAVSSNTIVNGRIDRPGDRDVYAFKGIAGRRMVAEIWARRLNSPLDSVLKITDAEGKVIAINDDHEDKGSGVITHHADSWVSFTLPTNKALYVHVGDIQNQGSVDHAYRLHLHPVQPDFALRVVPSAINALPGATVPISVYALRKDGFDGEIELGLKDAPDGFQLSGARIPAGEDSIRLTLTLPVRRLDGPEHLEMLGRAQISGKRVTRRAVPAEDMMQAFIYRHLVPAENWLVSNIGKGWRRPSLQLAHQQAGQGPLEREMPSSSSRSPDARDNSLEISSSSNSATRRRDLPWKRARSAAPIWNSGSVTGRANSNRVPRATSSSRPTSAGKPAAPVPKKPRNAGSPVGVLPAIPFRIVP